MCLWFGGIDFLGLIISVSCGSIFCACMSVLRLVLRVRRTFGYVLVYIQGWCFFLSFLFSLSHVEGWYWIRSRAMWARAFVGKKCCAIKIASVLILSRVNLPKWLRDKKSYVYVVAMSCYRTVFLRVIVTIEIRMLQDNFDGYWLVIKYRIIIVMFTIDENRVSDVWTSCIKDSHANLQSFMGNGISYFGDLSILYAKTSAGNINTICLKLVIQIITITKELLFNTLESPYNYTQKWCC